MAATRYADYPSGGFVFANRSGEPLREDTVNRRWHRALKAAGLPDARPYDARHSASSYWVVEAKQPLEVVASLFGHSSSKLLADRYVHALPDHVKRAAAEVAKNLAGCGQTADISTAGVA